MIRFLWRTKGHFYYRVDGNTLLLAEKEEPWGENVIRFPVKGPQQSA